MTELYRVRLGLSIEHWRPNLYCSICGEQIRILQDFNRDHQVPLSQGGKGGFNRRFAHVLCNTVKGDKYPFSLLTPADREAIKAAVTPAIYARLQRIWAGHAD